MDDLNKLAINLRLEGAEDVTAKLNEFYEALGNLKVFFDDKEMDAEFTDKIKQLILNNFIKEVTR